MAFRPGIDVLTSPALDRVPGLVHGFGTRAFDLPSLRRFARVRGFALVLLEQVHSADVVLVRRPPRPGEPLRTADALATVRAGVLLAVKTADCLPVLLADPERRAVAAVHGGWRGTRSRILERTVDVLAARFGSRPRALLAAFGPCIGGGCYEVGADVRAEFAAAGLPLVPFRPAPGRPGAFLLDLVAANRAQLVRRGVPARRISASGPCTHCDARLRSFRRDRGRAGRLYSFIGFRPAGL